MNTCPNCGLIKGLHASILPGCMCFQDELARYKKIVADQESIMTAQAMRIVDLKTHIENLEGEE
jgi:hypothetical protein